ncbi:hypothetical protein PJI17_07410 [Mycobacterium kansasii]
MVEGSQFVGWAGLAPLLPGRIGRNGVDPAITGEPSEEQRKSPVEPNGLARHSLQRAAVRRRGKRGGTAVFAPPARRRPRVL